MTKQKKKPSKVVFSPEIDSKINGLTLGFAFIAVGLFLMIVPDYFENELAGQIVRWLFIVTGALGLIAEFSGSKRFAAIKGFDDFFAGLIFVAFFAILYSISNVLILNIVGFLCLLIGTYGTFKGLF